MGNVRRFLRLGGACVALVAPAACGTGEGIAPSPAQPNHATSLLARRGPASGPVLQTLWNFTGAADGADPIGGVIADAAGNLYGGTIAGGPVGYGTIFEIAGSGPRYLERTLVTFTGPNGNSAVGSLAHSSSGELYGVTTWGGRYGYGTAFRVSTKPPFAESVIWSFGGNRNDGGNPEGGLVLDDKGALYGVTASGGINGDGIVFKLIPSGSGYIEAILHQFGGVGDGKYPDALLTLRPGGVIYGTAGGGGTGCSHGCGMVFELIPSGPRYDDRILYQFKGFSDGSGPSSAVTFDSKGAMYGVTEYGGGTECADGYGCGTLYKLTPSASDYHERVLWSFGRGTDGYYPTSNVLLGRKGALYGTAWQGGAHYGGTVYELVPKGFNYSESVLVNFTNENGSGYDPEGNLVMDGHGRIYGTCYAGGNAAFGGGTVFGLTP
ncbi:MAG TPA: choice-of-anchor tandem repeat GloVer-containing protein [Candidatus Cybelea sp.]|nr:choice-of-anchor tandem repeat GloVer-containing protein [Candidatus Cybelea sp.]